MNLLGFIKAKQLASQRLAASHNCIRDERGIGLAETLVAIAIIGITAVAFITALSTGALAVRESDQEAVAQQLARTQLEYVKSLPYDATGATYLTMDTPSGYTISLETDASVYTDTDIQELTVTIYRDSETILTVDAYKVKR
ncbi:MAG TPA: type II secretion system protein [Dehalococcoidia bacterium]|nr:type II secretion system protein [Dehalococcoidia bacterium]